MTTETEQQRLLRLHGLETETVGDILERETGGDDATASRSAGLGVSPTQASATGKNIERVCGYCGIIFFEKRARVAAGRGRFCSKGCRENFWLAKARFPSFVPEVSDEAAERWLPFPEAPVYLVSNFGRVSKIVDGRRKVLRAQPDVWGYLRVAVKISGKKKLKQIHRMVLTAWVGPPPSPDHLTRHLNGTPCDNRLVNLAWGTALENAHDRFLHGRTRPKKQHSISLTREDISAIRHILTKGPHYTALARIFKVKAISIKIIEAGDGENA